ncbi:PH domain-containing protein [Psychrobacter sp. FME5]|uniref:PH domain-containing protein n=1 Tax=Psychrobacter sp. FME5 TaxID=2487706 RepID=UPI0017880B39|nr:PH domain-containing protein [Psychrobacter sp. FME5]MBE0446210.1 PH domain-containing protein [Psychrobacter sp. FME5]
MGSYIDSNLTSSERVIQEAMVSWWSQWPFLLIGGLLLLSGLGAALGGGNGFVILLLAAFFIGVAVLRVLTTELALTNKRVIAKTGFIRRNTVELRLEKVEGLMVNQGIFGRILNYGSVLISGTGGIKTPIPFIAHPTQFRMVVNEFLENPSQFD